MVKLLTEYVKNGVYCREYKEFTREEYSQMLQNTNNNLGGISNVRKVRKRKARRRNQGN